MKLDTVEDFPGISVEEVRDDGQAVAARSAPTLDSLSVGALGHCEAFTRLGQRYERGNLRWAHNFVGEKNIRGKFPRRS